MIRIGYLGPRGTYTEKAAKDYFKSKGTYIAYKTWPELFQAVKRSQVDVSVLPIENSIEGSVNQTLDLLVQEQDIFIVGEIIINIEQVLLAKKEFSFSEITQVLSHGQALAQCSRFIQESLPEAKVFETVSTAKAAEIAASVDEPTAVIGNEAMAEIYNLKVIKKDIANCRANKTRFIVIAKDQQQAGQPEKTSLILSITDRPGGLYQILKEFALRNINLTKIESRPSKSGLGNYLFFIDFLGCPEEKLVAECLQRIKDISACFRLLGSYRAAEEQETKIAQLESMSLSQIREDIDIIDRQIVELLAKRTELVNIVGELKTPQQKVRDRNRENQIIERLTFEAKKKGVSPALIRRLYGMLFEHFVDLQESKRKKLKGILKRSSKNKK